MEGAHLIRDIEAAYKITGLSPIAGGWYESASHRASPLSALAIASGVLLTTAPKTGEDQVARIIEWAVSKFGYIWVQGFTQGVDGAPTDPRSGRIKYPSTMKAEYLQGYEAGTQVRSHFKLSAQKG